jgi:acetyl esterase
MKPLLLALFSVVAALPAARPAIMAKSNVVYSQAGGKALKLDLCIPDGPGPFAAVLLVHGGGWTAGDKLGDTKPLLAPLTQGGFAWFSINYRLAPQNRYPACLDDVYAAIRWLKAHCAEYRVDHSRIALLGESAGGQLAEMAAVQGGPETRVAAVVSLYGPCDLVAQTIARGGLHYDLTSLFGCSKWNTDTIAALRAASPLNFVHAGLPPFLLMHGTADNIVPYEQSVAFSARLKSVGVPCDLVTIPGGRHAMGIWNKVAPSYKTDLVVWLRKTLAAKGPALASR